MGAFDSHVCEPPEGCDGRKLHGGTTRLELVPGRLLWGRRGDPDMLSAGEYTALFPGCNFVDVNTPNICGQVGDQSVAELRQPATDFIDQVTNVSVTLDGTALKVRRVQSEIFEVAMPEDNLFDSPGCDVPGGVYSPSVDEGFYVQLKPLAAGTHTVHIQASGPGGFSQDVTYDLTVVPVTLK
jgi:hypothetical protein